MIKLDHKQLYELLELPQEVRPLLDAYGAERKQEIPEEIYRALFVREEWDEGVKALQSYLGNIQIILIAYTRNVKEDYSEFLGHSIHFAVSTDSGKTVIPLYHNFGRLFPKCEFSDENGIISMGVTDIEIYRIKDEYIITAKEIRRTNHGNRAFSVNETGNFVRWTTKNFVAFSEPAGTFRC